MCNTRVYVPGYAEVPAVSAGRLKVGDIVSPVVETHRRPRVILAVEREECKNYNWFKLSYGNEGHVWMRINRMTKVPRHDKRSMRADMVSEMTAVERAILGL